MLTAISPHGVQVVFAEANYILRQTGQGFGTVYKSRSATHKNSSGWRDEDYQGYLGSIPNEWVVLAESHLAVVTMTSPAQPVTGSTSNT